MIGHDLKSLYASQTWSSSEFYEKHDALADNVISRLGDLPGRRVLDLGCGSAALAVELAQRGFETVGLDWHIEPARHRCEARKVQIELIEQDMAEMAFREQFDAVVNWDVSGIGLLPTESENLSVVRRVYDALVENGKFLIETYNSPFARKHGIERLTYDSQIGRCVGTVTKKMPNGSEKTWELSIRLFSMEEWQGIFSEIGFQFMGAWGSLSGEELSDESRMLVVLGQK